MWKCPKCGETVEDDKFEVCWACGTSKTGVVDPHFNDDGPIAASENQPLEEEFTNKEETDAEHLVTVATCTTGPQAHAMRMQLEAAGIPVFLGDEMTIAMDWLLSNAVGGVKIQVAERHAERAKELIDSVPPPSERAEADDEAE